MGRFPTMCTLIIKHFKKYYVRSRINVSQSKIQGMKEGIVWVEPVATTKLLDYPHPHMLAQLPCIHYINY